MVDYKKYHLKYVPSVRDQIKLIGLLCMASSGNMLGVQSPPSVVDATRPPLSTHGTQDIDR